MLTDHSRLIGVGCAILVLVIVGIVAIALGGKSHSEGGPPVRHLLRRFRMKIA